MNMKNKIMGEQEKDLLFKDICARLPYKTLVNIDGNRYRMEEVCNALIGIDTYKTTVDNCNIEQVKPYLFPLSSMTEEQLVELSSISFEHSIDSSIKTLNWCYKNHFDINNLIPKGLAIDATGLNIY